MRNASSVPAQRMRGDDDVVERQQRIVGRGRLLVEDIERRAGDAALDQGAMQRRFVDDRAARGVDQIGRRLHQAELAGADQMAGLRAQGAADRDEVGGLEQRVEIDQLDPEPVGLGPIGLRIAGEMLHVERLQQPERLLADIAEADRADPLAGQAVAHVLGALVPAPGAGDPVLDEQFLRQGQNEGQDDGRDRPAHAVGRDRQHDAGAGAGLDIDRVVADAEARDDLEPPVGARQGRRADPRLEHDHPVIARRQVGRDLIELGRQDLPVDQRVGLEEIERGRIEHRAAVGVEDIAGQRDFEPVGGHRVPRSCPGCHGRLP